MLVTNLKLETFHRFPVNIPVRILLKTHTWSVGPCTGFCRALTGFCLTLPLYPLLPLSPAPLCASSSSRVKHFPVLKFGICFFFFFCMSFFLLEIVSHPPFIWQIPTQSFLRKQPSLMYLVPLSLLSFSRTVTAIYDMLQCDCLMLLFPLGCGHYGACLFCLLWYLLVHSAWYIKTAPNYFWNEQLVNMKFQGL